MRVREVNRVRKYNHQICMWKIRPGIIIMAFATHETNSTVL
jgi:hypothetical protein